MLEVVAVEAQNNCGRSANAETAAIVVKLPKFNGSTSCKVFHWKATHLLAILQGQAPIIIQISSARAMYGDIIRVLKRPLRRPSAGSSLLATIHSQYPAEWQITIRIYCGHQWVAHLFPCRFAWGLHLKTGWLCFHRQFCGLGYEAAPPHGQSGIPQWNPWPGHEARCSLQRSQTDSSYGRKFYDRRAMCNDWAKKRCHYGISEFNQDPHSWQWSPWNNTSLTKQGCDCTAERFPGGGKQPSGTQLEDFLPRRTVHKYMQEVGWCSTGVLQNHRGEWLRDHGIAKRTTLGSWYPVLWVIPTVLEPQTPGT
jgi:hypothetical protein